MPIVVREHHYTRSQQLVRDRFEGYQTVAWTHNMADSLLDQLDKLSTHTFESEMRRAKIPVYGYYPLGEGTAALTRVDITANVDASGRVDVQYARNLVLDEQGLEEIDYDVLGLLLDCPNAFSPQIASYTERFELRQITWTPALIDIPPCDQVFLAHLIDALLNRQAGQRLHLVTERPEDALIILRAAWIALPRAWVKQIRLRSPVDEPNNYTTDWNLMTLLRERMPSSLDGKLVLDVAGTVWDTPSSYATQAAASVFAGQAPQGIKTRKRLDDLNMPASSAILSDAQMLLQTLDQLTGNRTPDAFDDCCVKLLALLKQGVSGSWLVNRGHDLLALWDPAVHAPNALASLAPLADGDADFKAHWMAVLPPPSPSVSATSEPLSHQRNETGASARTMELANQEPPTPEETRSYYGNSELERRLQEIASLPDREQWPAFREFAAHLDPDNSESSSKVGAILNKELANLSPNRWQERWKQYLSVIAEAQASEKKPSKVTLGIAAHLVKEYFSVSNDRERASRIPRLCADVIAGQKEPSDELGTLWKSLPPKAAESRISFVNEVLETLLASKAPHCAAVFDRLVIEVLRDVQARPKKWSEHKSLLTQITRRYLGAEPSSYYPGQFFTLTQNVVQANAVSNDTLRFLQEALNESIGDPTRRTYNCELVITCFLLLLLQGKDLDKDWTRKFMNWVGYFVQHADVQASAPSLERLARLSADRSKRVGPAIYLKVLGHLSGIDSQGVQRWLLEYAASMHPNDPRLDIVFHTIATLPDLQPHVPAVLTQLQKEWKWRMKPTLERLGKVIIGRMEDSWPDVDVDGFCRVLQDIKQCIQET